MLGPSVAVPPPGGGGVLRVEVPAGRRKRHGRLRRAVSSRVRLVLRPQPAAVEVHPGWRARPGPGLSTQVPGALAATGGVRVRLFLLIVLATLVVAVPSAVAETRTIGSALTATPASSPAC